MSARCATAGEAVATTVGVTVVIDVSAVDGLGEAVTGELIGADVAAVAAGDGGTSNVADAVAVVAFGPSDAGRSAGRAGVNPQPVRMIVVATIVISDRAGTSPSFVTAHLLASRGHTGPVAC